jgi:hypothetical protein
MLNDRMWFVFCSRRCNLDDELQHQQILILILPQLVRINTNLHFDYGPLPPMSRLISSTYCPCSSPFIDAESIRAVFPCWQCRRGAVPPLSIVGARTLTSREPVSKTGCWTDGLLCTMNTNTNLQTFSETAELALNAALSSLEVDDGVLSVLTDEDVFLETACTLAEEVDPSQSFSYDIAEPKSMALPLAELLTALGYEGFIEDRASVLEFLTAEAQACRLLAHSPPTAQGVAMSEPTASRTASDADTAIATSISRLCAVFDIDANRVATIGTTSQLCELLLEIQGCIQRSISSLQALGQLLVQPEVASNLTETQLRECNDICEVLAKEHTLRKAMLLRRLEVTVQSFGYSPKATDDKFERVIRRVRSAVESGEYAVAIYHALFARDWLLDLECVSGGWDVGVVDSQVKRILMGSVPDRGGRVGAAANAAAIMPSLRPRSSARGRGDYSATRRSGGRGHGKGRGRGKK